MKTFLVIGSIFLSIGVAVLIYLAIVEKVLAVIADKLFDKGLISFAGRDVEDALSHPFFIIFIPGALGTAVWVIGAFYFAHDILMKALPIIAVVAGLYVFVLILQIIYKLLSFGLIILRLLIVIMVIAIIIGSIRQQFI